jgi:hypothetical protein
MTAECFTCDSIINNTGGLRCTALRYRKYIAGFVIGAVLVYILSRRR